MVGNCGNPTELGNRERKLHVLKQIVGRKILKTAQGL